MARVISNGGSRATKSSTDVERLSDISLQGKAARILVSIRRYMMAACTRPDLADALRTREFTDSLVDPCATHKCHPQCFHRTTLHTTGSNAIHHEVQAGCYWDVCARTSVSVQHRGQRECTMHLSTAPDPILSVHRADRVVS